MAGFNVKLATSGIAGVTELVTGVVSAAGLLAANTINILAEPVNGVVGSDFTVTLPIAPEDGAVVDFKNLLTVVDAMSPSVTRVVTIDRNGHNIDRTETNITTSTRNEVFRLVYINPDIGWAVI